MAIPKPDLPSGPVRDFVLALHRLYDLAGRPPGRAIAKAIIRLPPSEYESASHETVSAALRGSNVPGWNRMTSILTALANDAPASTDLSELLAEIRRLWAPAHTAAQQAAVKKPPAIPEQVTGPPSSAYGPDLRPGNVPDRQPLRTSSPIRRQELRPLRVSPPPAAVVSSLPTRTAHFTGREHLLGTMRGDLDGHPHVLLVLYGIIGSGKTQLVREFIERNGHRYPLVWWVPANSVERARMSLLRLAEAFGLPVHRRRDQTIRDVLARLESRKLRYLLVFDDAADEELRKLMPNVGGHVIVTTRDPAWAHDNASIGHEVPDFGEHEAVEFLRKRTGTVTDQQAAGMVDAVGRTPVALEQVVACQRMLAAEWGTFDLTAPMVLSTGRPDNYPFPAALSLLSAMDRLEEANPTAMMLFELFAYLGPAPLSLRLLRAGRTAAVAGALAEVLQDELTLGRVLTEIARHGLIRLSTEREQIEMAPLTRLVLRHAIAAESADQARRHVHALLAAADPGWPDDQPSPDLHAEIAEHVRPSGMLESRDPAVRKVVYHQIRFRYLRGEYNDARSLGEAAVTAWQIEGAHALDDHMVLRAMQQWANALRALGRYEPARVLTADAMSRLRVSPDYGENHADTLQMAGSYAADLRIAGEYNRALVIDDETHQRCQEKFGQANGRTTMSRHNLAVSLRLTGDFRRAEQEDRAALEQHQRLHGDDNWRTLLSINALVEDLYGLARYDEVLALEPRFGRADRTLTPMYRGAVLAGRMVALARRGLGQQTEALELLHNHYRHCVPLFGDHHEYTLALRMGYANTLCQLGRATEAYAHAVEACNAYRETFGQRNPLTLAAEINLAIILRTLGEREMSQAWQKDAVAGEALRDTVGPLHPFAVAAGINLATDYSLSRHPGTLTVSRRAYESAVKARGADHPDTLAAGANLALDLHASGAVERAADLRRSVLADLQRTLGPAHPTAATVLQGRRVECPIEPPST